MQAIGGYLNLELKRTRSYPHAKALHVNTARNALKLIILNHNIKRLYTPYFTCKSVLDSIRELNCEIKFYHINEDFSPKLHIKSSEWVLYTDYFGLNRANVVSLLKAYKNVIVDNAQSLFAPPSDICFYSPRKFVGLSDGGILYDRLKPSITLEKDISHSRANFLFKRLDLGAEAGYSEFKNAESSLDSAPIRLMSNLTKRLLNSLDYKAVKKTRIANFNTLNATLKAHKRLDSTPPDSTPMVYPYLSTPNLREYLIKHKVFIPTYWVYMEQWCKKGSFELHLKEHLLALPIDQRYRKKEMNMMLMLIDRFGGGAVAYASTLFKTLRAILYAKGGNYALS